MTLDQKRAQLGQLNAEQRRLTATLNQYESKIAGLRKQFSKLSIECGEHWKTEGFASKANSAVRSRDQSEPASQSEQVVHRVAKVAGEIMQLQEKIDEVNVKLGKLVSTIVAANLEAQKKPDAEQEGKSGPRLISYTNNVGDADDADVTHFVGQRQSSSPAATRPMSPEVMLDVIQSEDPQLYQNIMRNCEDTQKYAKAIENIYRCVVKKNKSRQNLFDSGKLSHLNSINSRLLVLGMKPIAEDSSLGKLLGSNANDSKAAYVHLNRMTDFLLKNRSKPSNHNYIHVRRGVEYIQQHQDSLEKGQLTPVIGSIARHCQCGDNCNSNLYDYKKDSSLTYVDEPFLSSLESNCELNGSQKQYLAQYAAQELQRHDVNVRSGNYNLRVACTSTHLFSKLSSAMQYLKNNDNNFSLKTLGSMFTRKFPGMGAVKRGLRSLFSANNSKPSDASQVLDRIMGQGHTRRGYAARALGSAYSTKPSTEPRGVKVARAVEVSERNANRVPQIVAPVGNNSLRKYG